MIEILFFTLACLWIMYTAIIDADHIKQECYIDDHSSRLINRALVGGLVAVFSWVGGLSLAFLFWALFDAFLNWFRGLPLFYTGQVATTDKFFSDKKYLLIASKIISLIIGLGLLFGYGL